MRTIYVKDAEQQNDPLLSYEERRVNNTHYPITEDTANKTANHCAHEYSHLAEFLPAVYQEFKDELF